MIAFRRLWATLLTSFSLDKKTDGQARLSQSDQPSASLPEIEFAGFVGLFDYLEQIEDIWMFPFLVDELADFLVDYRVLGD